MNGLLCAENAARRPFYFVRSTPCGYTEGMRRNRVFCLFTALAFATAITVVLLPGCSLMATRPVQEMADASAAIKAAREVGAQDRVPELYRQAVEMFARAKAEYRYKNFAQAKDLTIKARRMAEEAEFQAVNSGAERNPEVHNADPSVAGTGAAGDYTPAPVQSPDDYATPTGTPADDYEQRKKQEDAAKTTPGTSGSTPTVPVPAPNALPTTGK